MLKNKSGVLRISAGGGSQVSDIPFWTNGGNGVAFKWTMLDPDTGWQINSNTSFSFTDAGGLNTYTVLFNGGNGTITVTRTAGTTAFVATSYGI